MKCWRIQRPILSSLKAARRPHWQESRLRPYRAPADSLMWKPWLRHCTRKRAMRPRNDSWWSSKHPIWAAARSGRSIVFPPWARLLNACVAAGVSPHEMAADYDSVWLDFTKGLGAPLGAVLMGSAAFIDAAWRWKQRLGGALRQAGICAAACLYALDHHVERLADDHENARELARGLAQIPGIKVELPETNLVFFDTAGTGLTAEALASRLRQEGIMISVMGRYRARACLHLDVGRKEVALVTEVIRRVVSSQ